MKRRIIGVTVGGIIAVIIAFLLEQLNPIELCCISLPRVPNLEEPARLIAAQTELMDPHRHSGFPSVRTLRLLSAGRKYGPRVYGPDDRTDLAMKTSSTVDPKVNANMVATALIINDSHLTQDQQTKQWKLKAVTLGDEGVCGCERFSEQKSVYRDAACTGFLIDKRHVVTASHCVTRRELLSLRRFVFGFHDQPDGAGTSTFPDTHVSGGRDIVYRSDPCDNTDPDVIIVRLQKEVPISPAARSTQTVKKDDAVYVIGYPLGLPAKYAPGAEVRKNDPAAAHFVANIDGYEGNSGSPVFNTRHEIVGIHVRGVLALAQPCGCWNSTWCPNKACKGEEVTRIEFVPDPDTLYEFDHGDQFKLKEPLPPETNKCNGETLHDHRPTPFARYLERKYNITLRY